MATETLTVTGAVISDAFALIAGATKVIAVAAPDDEDTTCVEGIAEQAQSFAFSNPASITAGDSIQNVRFKTRAKNTAGDPMSVQPMVGATPVNTPANVSPGAAYADVNSDFTVKDTGIPWSYADILELGCEFTIPVAGGTHRITTLVAIITYTVGGYESRLPMMGVT